ncbi:MAG: rRNA pseudouridine synthase [Solobacterium sp.]|nr:rRNA pseudouridine synthase [Solobacterium sp.]
MERLQKIIAQAGIASRRKAEDLIRQGRVRVNGKVITELGYKASFSDDIEVDGKIIEKEEKVYYLLNKPKRTVCTLDDEKGRETVMAYLPEINARIFPVGRLDYQTTGVLILTNDGEFANLMMHPRSHFPKTYEAAIEGLITPEEIRQLRKGIKLEDGMTLPAKVYLVSQNKKSGKSTLTITITEGRNRQIRRMMEYFGYTVTRLDRKKYGDLDYHGLRQGEYRKLRSFEIREMIKQAEEMIKA